MAAVSVIIKHLSIDKLLAAWSPIETQGEDVAMTVDPIGELTWLKEHNLATVMEFVLIEDARVKWLQEVFVKLSRSLYYTRVNVVV